MQGPMRNECPRVVLVTDSARLAPGAPAGQRLHALERQIREAFGAGVDAVQIRERDLQAAALVDLTSRLVLLGRIIVTDRADVAVAAGAAGLHLRADGPAPARLRAWLPASMTLSRAVHDEDEAARFGGDPALDWLVAGTALPSRSKPGRLPLGIEGVRRIARASRLPVIAIGGVTAENAAALRRAGASGVAAIDALLPPITREYVDRLREASLE
jgi:thiamine-phosphate pyrophosphorylase